MQHNVGIYIEFLLLKELRYCSYKYTKTKTFFHLFHRFKEKCGKMGTSFSSFSLVVIISCPWCVKES